MTLQATVACERQNFVRLTEAWQGNVERHYRVQWHVKGTTVSQIVPRLGKERGVTRHCTEACERHNYISLPGCTKACQRNVHFTFSYYCVNLNLFDYYV